VEQYAYIRFLPMLAQELRTLAIDSNDSIKVKIPESMSAFLAHNDSLVIHFKKQENADKIKKIIQDWMMKNNIQESPREWGRTKLAKDSGTKSFSVLVSENIAEWLKENRGKYPSRVLAEEAIKHAIQQSQK
jgi:hypothetical protein